LRALQRPFRNPLPDGHPAVPGCQSSRPPDPPSAPLAGWPAGWLAGRPAAVPRGPSGPGRRIAVAACRPERQRFRLAPAPTRRAGRRDLPVATAGPCQKGTL